MASFLVKRFLESLVALWGVVTIVFFALRLRGDPVHLMLPLGATEEEIEHLRQQLGFDQPIIVQYVQYLGRVIRGDFGDSVHFGEAALPLVLERLGATAELALLSILAAIVIGGIAGTLAAVYRNSVTELLAMGFALIGQATPVFWLGIMLVLIFSVQLQWLPSGGRGSVSHLVLPVFTLAVFSSASIARLLRSSLLEIQSQDYIRTATAKGLTNRTVLLRHQIRNALIPVVTIIGIQTGLLLGGTVITETIFAWPGIGRLMVQAILNRDFPIVQAGAVVIAAIIVMINFIVDLLYTVLDPRIRLTGDS